MLYFDILYTVYKKCAEHCTQVYSSYVMNEYFFLLQIYLLELHVVNIISRRNLCDKKQCFRVPPK